MVAPITPLSSRLLLPAGPVSAIAPYARNLYQDRQQLNFFGTSPKLMKHMYRAAESAADWLLAAEKTGASAKQLAASASVWQQRSVSSSDANKLTGQAADGAKTTAYRVQVDALAASQTNRGFELAKNGPSVIEAGEHSFKLSIGDKTKTLNVAVGANDTNEQALGKLRDAINNAGIGMKAELSEDKTAGTVRLNLRSEATGTRHAFELEDIDGSAISASGIGNVGSAAADAVYRVNGGAAVVSSDNRISLDQGRVQLELKGVTERAVEVKVGLDADAIISRVKETVNSASRLTDLFQMHPGYLNPAIRRSLDDALGSGAADRLGIDRSGSGWKLNENELRSLIERSPDAARRELSGPSGLISRLTKATDRYAMMPAEALLSTAARGLQVYSPHLAGIRMDWMLPAGGWYVNTLF